MKERLDPLIEERAPWLYSGRPHHTLARRLLMRLLSYDKTIAIGNVLQDEPTEVIMADIARRIARDVTVTGLDNLPRSGPAIITANHPTGIADGVVLWGIVHAVRPDLFIYANSDILRVLPQMETLILPVEWRQEKRSLSKTRVTMDLTRKALEAGRLGVIFPSGRLAKRRGLRLYEREWMPSAAQLARKFDVPVVPLNIRARNSMLFYLFDAIHPTLRDITLFHEMLNKHRQPFRVNFGRPIPPQRLPVDTREATELLKAETLALGGEHAPQVSLVQMTRLPFAARHGRPLAGY